MGLCPTPTTAYLSLRFVAISGRILILNLGDVKVLSAQPVRPRNGSKPLDFLLLFWYPIEVTNREVLALLGDIA